MQFSDEQKKQLVQILLTALVVLVIQVAAVFGVEVVLPRAQAALAPPAQIGAQGVQPAQIFRTVRATNSMQNDGALTQTGAATFASTLAVTGNVTTSAVLKVGTFQRFGAGTAISVTNGITNLTPVATYQPLTSSGTVTVTTLLTATAFTQGDVVKFINTNTSGNIVFTNGTYLILPSATNLTLGPNDALELWFDGTKWLTVAASNN